jgi:hypothetical protein
MTRKLTLKLDRLTILTPDELLDVAGAQGTPVSVIICITDLLTVCDAQRCAG